MKGNLLNILTVLKIVVNQQTFCKSCFLSYHDKDIKQVKSSLSTISHMSLAHIWVPLLLALLIKAVRLPVLLLARYSSFTVSSRSVPVCSPRTPQSPLCCEGSSFQGDSVGDYLGPIANISPLYYVGHSLVSV
jgi:hypothetical protein